MISANLTPLAPSIRNYDGAPPPPPAPPVTTSPQPPTLPDDFAVSASATVGLEVGVAMSLVVATTSGSGAEPQLLPPAGLGAGLSLVHAWLDGSGTVTLSGTPAAPGGIRRLSLTFVSPEGVVRGSANIELVVVDPADSFTVVSQLSIAGRVAQPINETLATLSYSRLADVTAHLTGALPGVGNQVVLAWTPGLTSTGTLSFVGTPQVAGTYDISVQYRSGVLILGATTHSIAIGQAAAPPAPSPAPAPPAQPPAPAPAPAPPAPQPTPLPGSDDLLGSVIFRDDFEQTTQDVIDLGVGEGGESLGTALGPARIVVTPSGLVVPGGAISPNSIIATAPGASGSYSGRFANTTWFITKAAGSAALDLPLNEITLECYVKPVSVELWTTNPKGSVNYLFSIFGGRAAGGGNACTWSVGFLSAQKINGTAIDRQLHPYFYAAFADGSAPVALVGGPLTRGIGHVHLAGQLQVVDTDIVATLWCQGLKVATATRSAAGVKRASSVWLGRVGVTDNDTIRSAFAGYGVVSRDSPFGTFDIDNARATEVARYTAARGVAGNTIPAPMLQIPWPTY